MHLSPDEGDQCAICFEEFESKVELPCSCSVVYCAKCWDHALAESFRTSGLARCPTCRSVIRVDFDGDANPSLIFSPERRDINLLSRRTEQARLMDQARQAQVRLLVEYGARQQCSAGGAADGFPRCVCGSDMNNVTYRQRISGQAEGLGTSIICDLCNRNIRNGQLWTCTNGQGTVLHPASYDVCRRCFSHHAERQQAEMPSSPACSSDDSDGLLSLASGEVPPCCPSGHLMRADLRATNYCDMCTVTGTHYRCSQGCDFDLCIGCFHRVIRQSAGDSEEIDEEDEEDEESNESEESELDEIMAAEEWTCPTCTLINPWPVTFCDACLAPRPRRVVLERMRRQMEIEGQDSNR